MWNRLSVRSSGSEDNLPSQSTWRDSDEHQHPMNRFASITSPTSNTKTSSKVDDQAPRGFNPTFTSFSSTPQEQHPGAALASIRSSYAATSENINGEPHKPPELTRNVNPADQMPRSSSSRSSRDQEQARRVRDRERGKTERSTGRDEDVGRRKKRDKQDRKNKSLRRAEEGLDEDPGTSRGPADFPNQVASSGFSQFPGQYDEAMPAANGATHEYPTMSSHVQDQFPGQFPTQSSTPYRPPLAASEGGPGLAAEYYGDAGQSVAEQPGNRVNTPSLIVGAEPHLQPALAVAAPPPEPSASGAVGAAASFFSGEFEEDEAASSHGPQSSSTYVTGQIRPSSNHHSSSAPVIPTISGTLIGSAAGYLVDSQTSLHQQPPQSSSLAAHRPPSKMQGTHNSSTSQSTKPSKQSSQLSGNPMYIAGLAGAAGLAAAAYDHNNHPSDQNHLATSQHSTTSMAQRHHNRGPLSAFVNFFKDPEGVAQFEEYSQIIGVCRHCFAPGSSPRDAPRKHFYGRRRSNERYGSSTRVDKDNRYYSSENEGRRKNKPWFTTGLAGYGLAKVGKSFFNENDDAGYSVKSGRFPPDGRDRKARGENRSKEHVEIGITGDIKSDGKGAREDVFNGTETARYSTRRRSRTRSRSEDRKGGLAEATVGASFGASVVASTSRPQGRSPHRTSVKSNRMSQASSPERRQKTKKKRSRGFFSFGNGSSSSSSVDLAFTGSQTKHRSSKRSTGKSKDDKQAEAALLGLGAAAAALALNDGRQGHRKKGVKERARVKETKDDDGYGSAQARRSKKSWGSPDDELWESAAEDDYESMNSDLAYGAPVRKDSRASLSSESSGTNKWGWRWGSKKERRVSPPPRKSSDHSSFPTAADAYLTGSAPLISPDQRQGSAMTSTSSLPLQHLYPVPTSDPSRFDVGLEAPVAASNTPAISSRPEAVPLQHPQPIAPVSTAIYSSQAAYDHSYSAPAGVAVFSQARYDRHPGTSDDHSCAHEASIPGSLPRFEQQANDLIRDSKVPKVRRRDTSPARFGADSTSSSMQPRRRSSVKDESSAVRFDLTEEQEERERRERRRKRNKDKERREAEEQEREQTEKERRATKERLFEEQGSRPKLKDGPERSEKSWVGPTATGIVAAAIGSAAITEISKSDKTRDERRERRRRERELENEEDARNKRERRRRQRERDYEEAAINESRRLPDEYPASSEYVDHQGRSTERRDMSVWQEAASAKRSSDHEDYRAFFTPLELLNRSSDQVKITSANADADVDLDQVPQIVTVEPKRTHDLSDSPTISFADIDDKVDPSRPSFPWQVPRLRLVEPTPPSTRGSTPLLQPKDAGDERFEESRKDGSPSNVKWADDQNREYTIIAPKEDHDESVEPLSGDISGTDLVDLSRNTHDRDSPDDKTLPHKVSTMENSSTPLREDVEFAATLAASAEDAGFDPSIVIDNPTYRRRDSPPGSNERSMPGVFDHEDEPRLKKKERKKNERTSRHQSQNDGPNRRGGDPIVQDIISQVPDPESRPSNQAPLENLADEWQSTKEMEHNKSENEWKGSASGDNVFETSDLANHVFDSKNHDVYKLPIEDIRSTSLISNEAESSAKSREESQRDSSAFDDDASTVFLPFTNKSSENPEPKPKERRRVSLWDRVLGKSTDNVPQEIVAEIVTKQANLEGFEEPETRKEVSEERNLTGDRDDDYDSKKRNITGGNTPQVLHRLSQDPSVKGQGTSLPSTSSGAGSVAKYLDHGEELKQEDKKQSESFLGTRPEPPPPPDNGAESKELFAPLETTSLPNSPGAESETKNRRFSDAGISNKTRITAALPSSPTAVPFLSGRLGRSSSNFRSLSQTPLSSTQSAADSFPKQKTRPHSTEFKSSKDIWPMLDEVYPSLPSSHTTSRSSSVHATEEREHHQNCDYELNEIEHEPIEVEPTPMISTDTPSKQLDLLDSQQATPTASSFQDSTTVLDSTSAQACRDLPPKAIIGEKIDHPSSKLKSETLGAILRGSAAAAINEKTEKHDSLQQDLRQDEHEEFERGLDNVDLDTVTCPSPDDNLDQEEDFSPQKAKKGEKNMPETGQSRQGTVQTSLAEAAEAMTGTAVVDPQPLSLETVRQTQEQDAQDAADSWFPSVRSSTKAKRSKQDKNKTLVKRLPEESGASTSTCEPPGDNLGIVVSAEGQENDSLTREMSRKQVVDIMTAAAQDADKDEDKLSQSATVVAQAPAEIQVDENLTEPKGEQANKCQKDLPQDDLPQDSLQRKTFPSDDIQLDELQTKALPPHDILQGSFAEDDLIQGNLQYDKLPQLKVPEENYPQDDPIQVDPPRHEALESQQYDASSLQRDPQPDSLPTLSSYSAPAMASLVDPYLQIGRASLLETPKTNPVLEEVDRDDLIRAISPQPELSPRAIPLPDGNDEHDLSDERLGTPIITSPDHYDNEEKGIATQKPLDVSPMQDPLTVIPGLSQYFSSQADQTHAGEDSAVPLTKNSKKAKRPKKAKQDILVEDNETSEMQGEDGPLPNMIPSPTPEVDRLKRLNKRPATETPQLKSETADDESGGFINSQKAEIEEESRQSSLAQYSKTTEMRERQESLNQVAASEVLEDHEALKSIDESAVDFFQPETESLKEESTGLNGKDQSTKREDIKPDFSVENAKTTEVKESELLPKSAAPREPEYRGNLDLLREPAMPVPEPELVEDVPKDLNDELSNQALKPTMDQDEWARPESGKKSKQAQTNESENSHLGSGPEEIAHQFEQQSDSRDDWNDHPLSLATTLASHDVSAKLGPSEIEASIVDEPKKAFPNESQAEHTLQKPIEGRTLGPDEQNLPMLFEPETPQSEYGLRKGHNDDRSSALETSVAITNVAQVVQDILAEGNNVGSTIDAKSKAMAISTGIDEATAETPVGEEDLDWDAPKKKKAKKGKKNEAFSWDEPEMVRPTEVSGPSWAVDTPLVQEPVADRSIEEYEVDRDAAKKKKKGKKGKKNEAFLSDEPKVMEPVILSDPLSAIKPPLLEQEGPAETNDEAFPKQSKKDKKGKKGKKKGVSKVTDDLRDEGEPNVVPAEVPRDEDLPAIASDSQDVIEASGILTLVSQDDQKAEDLDTITCDSRNEVEPGIAPTEILPNEDKIEDQSAVSHPLVTSVVREEFGPTPITTEAPPDRDSVEDVNAEVMLPCEVEIGAPGEMANTALPTETAQDDRNKPSQEASLEREETFMSRKGKKDKKKSKKSKKSKTIPLDVDESLTPGAGQVAGAKVLEKGELDQINPYGVVVVAESDRSVPKIPSEQQENFTLPTKKKDKKKSKKHTAFSLDEDIIPAIEDEPASQAKDNEQEVPMEIFPSSIDVVKESGTNDEALPEKNKDRDETEKAQPDIWESENLTADSQPEPPQDLEKDAETNNNISTTTIWRDHGMMDGKQEQRIHEGCDSTAADAATAESSPKPSSLVSSPVGQSVDVPEETLPDHAKELKGNLNPLAENDVDSLLSPKSSKKDKKKAKKAKKARAVIGEEDGEEEISQEPRASPKKARASNHAGEPPINLVPQHGESWLEPEISALEVESREIIEQNMGSGKDRGHQGLVMDAAPSQARHDFQTTVEVHQDDSFIIVEKSEKGERAETEEHSIAVEEDESPAGEEELTRVTASSPVQESAETLEEQPRNDMHTDAAVRSNHEGPAIVLKEEQAPISTEPQAVAEANAEGLTGRVPVQVIEKPGRQQDKAQWDESRTENLHASVTPGPVQEIVETIRNAGNVVDVEPLGSLDKDDPTLTMEAKSLDAKKQREYSDFTRELERATPNGGSLTDPEPPRGPEIDMDKPVPAVEIEMLDAQEQRNYNEEYAKELERQLSPLQRDERAESSSNEGITPVFSESSILSTIERPYDEEHRPLARPPALEDIIEESSSRPGSVQGTPVDREDEPSPIKSNRKSKKSKKSKKQQPVIWEDETATLPLEPESGQGAEPSVRTSEASVSWTTDTARPTDLEETLHQHSFKDRAIASPTEDSNIVYKESEIENDRSDDYFAIQPSRPAEEDVGREDTREFRRALATEPPYTSEDHFSARDMQADDDNYTRDEAVKNNDQEEGFAPLATESPGKPRTEMEPAGEHVEDDFGPASMKTIDECTTLKKKASARESSAQALEQDDVVDPEILAANTLTEKSPSPQYSLEDHLREDEPSSVAEGRSASRGKSGRIAGVAAAVGLGVSGLTAQNLSSKGSKQERRHDEKAQEVGTLKDFDAEAGETEDSFVSLDRGNLSTREQEHRRTPEAERLWQHGQAASFTPPRSPPSANHRAVADHVVEEGLGKSSETPEYRDSAIYVSGSPTISEEIPHHHIARDSGYTDTDARPTIDHEIENIDTSGKSGRGVAVSEKVGHLHRRHSRAQETERQRSISRNPSEISVDASSDYDVSESRLRGRRRRSRRRSGVAYDSDDSADSGFDVQRRRRRQAIAAEPREPSPVSSTTRDKSSAPLHSSLSAREEITAKPQDRGPSPRYDPVDDKRTWSFDHEGSPQQRSQELLKDDRPGNIPEGAPESTAHSMSPNRHEARGMSLFGGPQSYGDDLMSPSRSPRSSEGRGRRRLNTISESSAEGSLLQRKDKRALSDVGSPESGVKGRRMRSPPVEGDVGGEYVSIHDAMSRQPWPEAVEEKGAREERSRSRNSDQLATLSSRHSGGATFGHREEEHRTASAGSMRSEKNGSSIHAIIRTPDQVRSASGLSYRSSTTPTPPLRRVDRSASGDLRGASKKDEAKSRAKSRSELEPELDLTIPSSSTYDPVTDKGKSRADMTDIYEGWGDVRGQSPMSPTRPPSMRKRQSMQLLDLETRLDQLVSENRLLASQKLTAENALQEQARDQNQERHAYEEALQEHKTYLTRKNSEMSELRKIIEQLQDQAAHLTEVNEELASSRDVHDEHEQRCIQLQADHAHTYERWQQSTRELENLKEQHTQLSTGMEEIVRHEVTVALEEKNVELRQLQNELENAKQQVRNLQQQLLASRNSDDFVERDEDYFDSRCQSLCQHVQQWVLRFSKFSDMKACYLAREVQDEKVVDRMENAILDGSDVDDYLSDRVKRRDVFMSVVMTMIWEFIFTRYLFGMDREQRQKLKNLEKTLQEVGPISAVHKWRATTLTLLMKREAFENQRATDTEAVVHEIYDTLATFLPPPSHLVGQIQDSLRKVIDAAVDLSIEMRTQRAEYSMLPPLQPEYDTNGDLARKVYFSALTMNERSGATSSNEALQEQQAVVRMVLFPLVVKNEDDDEQTVVCPAQVLTAEGSKGKKTVRVLSAQGGRSEASFAGSDVRMEGGMI